MYTRTIICDTALEQVTRLVALIEPDPAEGADVQIEQLADA